MTILKKHVDKSVSIANRTNRTLLQRGLEPRFTEWTLTADGDLVLLFGVLDVRRLQKMERYTDRNLLHQLSTVCNGVPIAISNTNGLRYAFILDHCPAIPATVDFPGFERGKVRLGLDYKGNEVGAAWDRLGHLLIGGQTGMGKSNLLRLLAYQGIGEGSALLLADIDGRTFPMLAGNPALMEPIASTPDEAHELVKRALAEIDRRTALYSVVDGYPETLDEYNDVAHDGDRLPRLLVILDEFNATACALGGAKGHFCNDVSALTWRGRKFGVNVIVAAQDFEKAIVGRMRDQVDAVCFRVRSYALARAVGCASAVNIPSKFPGRAVSSRWGVMQTYYISKGELATGTPSVLSQAELALIKWAQIENDSYLPIVAIRDRLGLSQRRARARARDWERRGWLVKDANSHNRRKITSDLALLADKVKTAQTAQTRCTNGQTPHDGLDKRCTN